MLIFKTKYWNNWNLSTVYGMLLAEDK